MVQAISTADMTAMTIPHTLPSPPSTPSRPRVPITTAAIPAKARIRPIHDRAVTLRYRLRLDLSHRDSPSTKMTGHM